MNWPPPPTQFVADYAAIETKAVAEFYKTVNFGLPGGAPARYPASYQKVDCEKCGKEFTRFRGHTKRECTYGQALREMERKGWVPIHGMMKSCLKEAGVHTQLALRRSAPEKQKHSLPQQPYQKAPYAPVWAVLVIVKADLNGLTSPKRPRVKRVIEDLRRLREDQAERDAILGEHILEGGPYTAACKALIGRTMR
jgi:hypothetical protein